MIANQESGFKQFNTVGDYINEPNWGPPCGFGVMQRDPPPSLQETWNWTANVDSGLARMRQGNRDADWSAQMLQFTSFQALHPGKQQPCAWYKGSCNFAFIATRPDNIPGTPKPWGDANYILAYNFGPNTTERYIKWNVTLSQWDFAPLGTRAQKYVDKVCSKQP